MHNIIKLGLKYRHSNKELTKEIVKCNVNQTFSELVKNNRKIRKPTKEENITTPFQNITQLE